MEGDDHKRKFDFAGELNKLFITLVNNAHKTINLQVWLCVNAKICRKPLDTARGRVYNKCIETRASRKWFSLCLYYFLYDGKGVGKCFVHFPMPFYFGGDALWFAIFLITFSTK